MAPHFTTYQRLQNRFLRGGLCCACAVLASVAAAEQRQSLLSNSPFLPPGHNQPQARPTAPTPPPGPNTVTRDLELRGIYEFDGEINLSIFNRRTQVSKFITLDKRDKEVFATQFNPEERSARITFEGSTATLSLKTPSESPIAGTGQEGGGPTNIQRPQPPGGDGQQRPSVPRRRVILPAND